MRGPLPLASYLVFEEIELPALQTIILSRHEKGDKKRIISAIRIYNCWAPLQNNLETIEGDSGLN